MTDTATLGIDLPDLNRLLQAVDPAVLLVPPRLLRRVIKHDRGVAGFSMLVPHRRSFVVAREDLLKIIRREELGLSADTPLPAALILIAQPNPEALAAAPRAITLLKYWRTLFHARVHVAVEQRLQDGHVTEAGIQQRIRAIGEVEFEEIRTVLQQDEYLLPPGDDRTVYVEFVAVYLELRHFAAPLLRRCFPSIERFDHIDQLLAADVDGGQLFSVTRPEGAPDPIIPEEHPVDDPEGLSAPKDETPEQAMPAYRLFKTLNRRAKKADARGNVVRAAISKFRASAIGPPKRREEMRSDARAELQRLAGRLQEAIGLGAQDATSWRKALAPLLPGAAHGFWPSEARLLYDLQKVCIDREQELYSVDLVEWALALGRRPLKRPVPCQRAVLLVKHLRSAAGRVRQVRLADADRARLTALLQEAVHACEEHLRARFRPLIRETLEAVEMTPHNLPERVALNKLVEELLDRTVERGFFALGDLRDAISRNNLKAPDLTGPREWLQGDQLIRANRRLAVALDGVYRRGEIYLRWLQRLSSPTFGTPLGRLATRYLILPFGGAFVLLKGVHFLIEEGEKLLHFLQGIETPKAPDHLTTPLSVGLFGAFLLALINVPAFRRHVGGALWLAYRGLHALFVDLPAWLLGLPLVQKILHSVPFRFFWQYLGKPLLVATVPGVTLWAVDFDWENTFLVSGATFLAASVFLNTRLGRTVEEELTDILVHVWQRLHFELIPAVFRFVMALFKRFVEGVDRFLYRVDEWLRFRRGDSWVWLVFKPILGLFWFALAYTVRIYVNLMIEPTFNPIKHFPVVTVAAKLMLPVYRDLIHAVAAALNPLVGSALSYGLAVLNVSLLPGVFGFLVWELKENWRLYEANRSPALQPVVIGHHGETISRFLRPGFHSGTIPKLYAKIRRAERSAQRSGDWRPAHKHRETLQRVEENIRHFVDRELVFLLNESNRLGPARLSTREIELSTNRIRVELCCPWLDSIGLVVDFEERAGRLAARISQQGWLSKLSGEQRQTLAIALAGLYKMAAVYLVHEQQPIQFPFPVEEGVFNNVPIPWVRWIECWDPNPDSQTVAV